MRLLLPLTVLAVAGAAGWWLLRPEATPVGEGELAQPEVAGLSVPGPRGASAERKSPPVTPDHEGQPEEVLWMEWRVLPREGGEGNVRRVSGRELLQELQRVLNVVQWPSERDRRAFEALHFDEWPDEGFPLAHVVNLLREQGFDADLGQGGRLAFRHRPE